MDISKKITLGVLCLVFTKLAFSAEIGLNYEINNKKFILNKACIAQMQIRNIVFESKEYYSMAIKLKDTPDCAQQLNDMISKNIGKHLLTYFGSEMLIDSYMSGALSTEKGFKMPLASQQLGEDILSFYNNNN